MKNKGDLPISRRNFLSGMMASALMTTGTVAFAPSAGAAEEYRDTNNGTLKITDLEFVELHGQYETEGGVDRQQQVNPLDIYDDLRPGPYEDKPAGNKQVDATAIYLKVHTSGGLDGLYGPIDREIAVIILEDLRSFLIGKDALAGEKLWDEMYRSNRHSRAGYFLMAISAVDNALWDVRGRYFNVPVYRLLGGPTRSSVEAYASCLGFSLEPEAVRKRCLSLKAEGYRNQKWFMAYGPGSGPEGMRKNVELVQILRETLGDDTELMFDAYSGWDLTYALEWAHQVEKYRPRWIEEAAHPEKLESFVTLRRSTTIPVAAGEHIYGRWEVERYLEAGALSVLQTDPEWCGGVSELLKIGAVASVYDVPVIPHGHSVHAALHVIASQSPMTFPLAEYLIIKMRHYYHFEKNPPVPVNAHLALPTGAGFGIELDPAKIQSTTVLHA